ncbi:LOW QUALITY PROTEIN: hypothetical protein CVT25_014673 [Psilocybe cyanescens]|uniref:Uncharacterized protein n=1 Tax=Psilocybe cyanescens TaxID=93625 RepID=A0A409X8U8_PSICY|nr:LOW QUALITY PROTEIN: hypothetical protein CVT25_014673 [Psilocybe cyanescens]
MYPWVKSYATYRNRNALTSRKAKKRSKAKAKKEPTNNGTSLLINNCTLPLKLALLEKLTKYLREKVSETCWFISMTTPAGTLSSSSSSAEDLAFDLPLEDFLGEVLAFLEVSSSASPDPSAPSSTFGLIVPPLTWPPSLCLSSTLPFAASPSLANRTPSLETSMRTLSPSCERSRTMRVNSADGRVTRASYSVSGMVRVSASMSMSFMSYSAMRSESARGGGVRWMGQEEGRGKEEGEKKTKKIKHASRPPAKGEREEQERRERTRRAHAT